MTNVNNPTGARAIGSFNTAKIDLKVNKYVTSISDSTPLYVGDCVSTSGSSSLTGIPVCTKAGDTGEIRGVVVSIEPLHTEEDSIYRKASTERIIHVCDDPYVMLEMQVNGTLTAADVGKFANKVSSGGDNITGLSDTQIDLTTVSTISRQFKIIGVIQREGNELGLYSKVRCIIHDHELQHGATGSEENLWKLLGGALTPFTGGTPVDLASSSLLFSATGAVTINELADSVDVTSTATQLATASSIYSAILALSATQYEFFTATAGQTAFTIVGPAPINAGATRAAVNGILYKYGSDANSDFTITGNAFTWYNNNYTLQLNDVLQIWYDGPGPGASRWGEYSGTMPAVSSNLLITAAALGLNNARQITCCRLMVKLSGVVDSWTTDGNNLQDPQTKCDYFIPAAGHVDDGDLYVSTGIGATSVAGQPFKLSYRYQSTNFLT